MKTKKKLIASLKIWVVIYPAITLFLYLLGGVISGLPLYIRTLLITVTLVPVIVFVGVPAVDKFLHMLAAKKNSEGLTNG